MMFRRACDIRRIALGCACWCAFVSVAPVYAQNADDSISVAARSPYDLQHFIETHFHFSLRALATALHIQHDLGIDCEGDAQWHSCSSELINVTDPARAIVCVRWSTMAVAYLVYIPDVRNEQTQWRFAGY